MKVILILASVGVMALVAGCGKGGGPAPAPSQVSEEKPGNSNALVPAAPTPAAPVPGAPAAASEWVLEAGYPKADPEGESLTNGDAQVKFEVNRMSFTMVFPARGNEPAIKGDCTIDFSAPPARITAGKPYPLTIQGKASDSLFQREPVRPGGYYIVTPIVDAIKIRAESIKLNKGLQPKIDGDRAQGFYLGCDMAAIDPNVNQIVYATSGEAVYTLTVSANAPDEFLIFQTGTYGHAANCAVFRYKKASGVASP